MLLLILLVHLLFYWFVIFNELFYKILANNHLNTNVYTYSLNLLFISINAMFVNGKHYRLMMTNVIRSVLHYVKTSDIFWQDVAHGILYILHNIFEGMVVSRAGDVYWSPRLCDLIWVQTSYEVFSSCRHMQISHIS